MHGSAQSADDGPLPPDEGWWAAVLRDDESCPEGGIGTGRAAGASVDDASGSGGDWELARQLHEADRTIELEVTGFNRGGLLVHWNSLQGFVPVSHLLGLPAQLPSEQREEALAQRVNSRLQLKVIELDVAKKRIVFSERAARSSPGARRRLLESLNAGDVASGVVTNVCDFGVFVDLGGLEGLIHVSELSWSRVMNARQVLECDRPVRVMVIGVEREQGRVALSLKRLCPDPWETVAQRYIVGQMVEGEVTSVVNFGAFVCVEAGVEGLIHVSELAEGSILDPRAVVQEGERVRARILSIDCRNRRLGLSLRWTGPTAEPVCGTPPTGTR